MKAKASEPTSWSRAALVKADVPRLTLRGDGLRLRDGAFTLCLSLDLWYQWHRM